jgi:hypothetical protein
MSGMGKAELTFLADLYRHENPHNKRKGAGLTKHMTAFVEKKMKEYDCGCGCKGMKKLRVLAGAAYPHLVGDAGRADEREKRRLKRHGELKGGKLSDCPAGYRNDGLTCIEECKSDEIDTGLTCVKKCPSGYRDDGTACRSCPPGYTDTGLTCFKPASGGQVYTKKTYCASGNRDLFGNCYAWDLRLEGCPSGYNDDGLLCRAPLINAETVGQNVIVKGIRGKDIKGRVDWKGTMEEVEAGVKEAFSGNGELARLFDPSKNGVGESFRKFGENSNRAFADIGDKMANAFDPNKNGVGDAFKKLGDTLNETLGNENWWKETMSSPDTYLTLLTMIAATAATVLSAGALGPAAVLALSALGPATKMIGDAAQGKPIDGLDIASLVLGLIPVPGAGAAAASAGKAIVKAATTATTAAKALPYVQRVAQVGKFVVSSVKTAQSLGVVPSTCLANCGNEESPEDGDNGAEEVEFDASDFADNEDFEDEDVDIAEDPALDGDDFGAIEASFNKAKDRQKAREAKAKAKADARVAAEMAKAKAKVDRHNAWVAGKPGRQASSIKQGAIPRLEEFLALAKTRGGEDGRKLVAMYERLLKGAREFSSTGSKIDLKGEFFLMMTLNPDEMLQYFADAKAWESSPEAEEDVAWKDRSYAKKWSEMKAEVLKEPLDAVEPAEVEEEDKAAEDVEDVEDVPEEEEEEEEEEKEEEEEGEEEEEEKGLMATEEEEFGAEGEEAEENETPQEDAQDEVADEIETAIEDKEETKASLEGIPENVLSETRNATLGTSLLSDNPENYSGGSKQMEASFQQRQHALHQRKEELLRRRLRTMTVKILPTAMNPNLLGEKRRIRSGGDAPQVAQQTFYYPASSAREERGETRGTF